MKKIILSVLIVGISVFSFAGTAHANDSSQLQGIINAARIQLDNINNGESGFITYQGQTYDTAESLEIFIAGLTEDASELQAAEDRAAAKFDYRGPTLNGPGLTGGATIVEGRIDGNVSRERNLKELIIGWTNFLLSIAAIMAVVALVWAGFLYITAFGDDSRMETAKKIVIWVVIGILLILAAYAIVNTVMRAVF